MSTMPIRTTSGTHTRATQKKQRTAGLAERAASFLLDNFERVVGAAAAVVVLALIVFGFVADLQDTATAHENTNPRVGPVVTVEDDNVFKKCDGSTLDYYSHIRYYPVPSSVENSAECR